MMQFKNTPSNVSERHQVIHELAGTYTGDGRVDLDKAASVVKKYTSTLIPLMNTESMRVCGHDETDYAGDELELEAWKDFYLPERMEMVVIGVIDDFPTEPGGEQLVLLLCEDGNIYAYDDDELLHHVAKNVNELETDFTFPGIETFQLGEYIEDPTEEQINEVMQSEDVKEMRAAHKEYRDSMARNLLKCIREYESIKSVEEDMVQAEKNSDTGKFNGICEDNTKLEVRNKAEIGEEGVATPPVCREYPPTGATGHDVHAAPESAQYAVVKKALRKTRSVSECMIASDVLPFVQESTDIGMTTENNTPDPVFSNIDKGVGGDVAHPVDAPYARVNKPQRPAQPSSLDDTDASVWGAAAAADQSFPNVAAVAEQKYWELEPMHTYEETLHTRTRADQIDCYAVGRHRENNRDADLSASHVYSEVNIKGTRDDPLPSSPPLRAGTTFLSTPSSTRPVPRLPQRPAHRPPHAPARPEGSTQNFGNDEPPPPYQSEQLLPDNKEFSIYEQIPERWNKSRPPLPPLNPKH